MNSRKDLFSCMIMSLVMMAGSLYAQVPAKPVKISTKVPYYINVNTADRTMTYDIQEGLLHFQYEDKHGSWKKMKLQVRNWKFEPVGTFEMDKTFGLNHYTIDLRERIAGLENNQDYFCSITDEGGNVHEWKFKSIPPVKSTDLIAAIRMNPVRVECSKESGNLAEFYSEIKNGVAPFTVHWYVMDMTMNNFLYQPREEKLRTATSGSMIQVDKAPGYYVILDVTDACGTNTRQMVYLDCEQLKKKTNTVFLQQPSRIPGKKVKSQ
jgi:hypothetical protein